MLASGGGPIWIPLGWPSGGTHQEPGHLLKDVMYPERAREGAQVASPVKPAPSLPSYTSHTPAVHLGSGQYKVPRFSADQSGWQCLPLSLGSCLRPVSCVQWAQQPGEESVVMVTVAGGSCSCGPLPLLGWGNLGWRGAAMLWGRPRPGTPAASFCHVPGCQPGGS